MRYLGIFVLIGSLLAAAHALLTKKKQGVPEAVLLLGFGLVALGGDVSPIIGSVFVLGWIIYEGMQYLRKRPRG